MEKKTIDAMMHLLEQLHSEKSMREYYEKLYAESDAKLREMTLAYDKSLERINSLTNPQAH